MKAQSLHTRLWTALALACAAALATAQAAEMTIFKQPNFTGDKLTLTSPANDLSTAGFQDQASSVVVRSGQWLVCTQPDFNGDCATLGRGRYPQLDARLNHRIESVREVTQDASNDQYGNRGYVERDRDHDHDRARFRDRDAGRYAYSGFAPVEVFTAPDFRGRARPLDGDTGSLFADGDNRGAASIVIHEGTWQLCSQPGYGGECEVYQPGRYADLGELTHRLNSLRRIG